MTLNIWKSHFTTLILLAAGFGFLRRLRCLFGVFWADWLPARNKVPRHNGAAQSARCKCMQVAVKASLQRWHFQYRSRGIIAENQYATKRWDRLPFSQPAKHVTLFTDVRRELQFCIFSRSQTPKAFRAVQKAKKLGCARQTFAENKPSLKLTCKAFFAVLILS